MNYRKIYNKIGIGDVVEHFTVLSEASAGPRGRRRWLCRCSCGTERIVEDKNLKNRNTVSCGCAKQAGAQALGLSSRRHGESWATGRSAEYKTWQSLLGRCKNPTNPKYPRYGGRGITVCDRWLTYENFLIDMGRKPSPKHTIERKDNNGNYSPENCVWATAVVQARNKSNNRLITYQGVTRCLAEWAELLGIRYATLWARLNYGWPIDKAFATPAVTNSN